MKKQLLWIVTLCAIMAQVARAGGQTADPSAQVDPSIVHQDNGGPTTIISAPASGPLGQVKPSKTYKAAIFVSNHAGRTCDDKLSLLEDYVTAQVGNLGLSTISREITLNAVSRLDGAAADPAEKALAQNTSAMRLAQNLNADCILYVTIASFDTNVRTVNAYGIQVVNSTNTLRVAYKLIDGTTGGSLAADTVELSKAVQQNGNAAPAKAAVLNEMLADASQKLAAGLKARLDEGQIALHALPPPVTVNINTEVADIYIPDIRVSPENVVTIGSTPRKVTPLNVTIELDGMAVGTAPSAIQLRPGTARLRLTREGFLPWERTITVVDGLNLSVAMSMTPDALQRFKESTAFFNTLRSGNKLTDAQVKVLEGQARMLEQSYFKVDTHENFRFILPASYQNLRG